MGISISHGVPSTRSATTIALLGKQLAHALTSSEWREIDDLFGGRFSDVASIPPHEAGRIGDLLHKAASHRVMDPEWGELATLLGHAAKRAARACQNWEWT